eukprot:358229-Chlamydomonas_euryale.AAC.7
MSASPQRRRGHARGGGAAEAAAAGCVKHLRRCRRCHCAEGGTLHLHPYQPPLRVRPPPPLFQARQHAPLPLLLPPPFAPQPKAGSQGSCPGETTPGLPAATADAAARHEERAAVSSTGPRLR